MNKRLNGRWVNKADSNITVFVEKVFKKGYVTGFIYTKTPEGEIHGQMKMSQEELLDNYERA